MNFELNWPRCTPAAVPAAVNDPVDAEAYAAAEAIVRDVEARGAAAVRASAERFGERTADEPLLLGPDALAAARARIDPCDRALLERTTARVRTFADAQRAAIHDVDVPIPGGRAGHTVEPVGAVGAYAPGGRYPLPSSAIMTIVPARAAGCARVVLATPNPNDFMLATAAIAGADAVLGVGGPAAIGAFAFGIDGMERVDVLAGPGNKYMTAAKKVVVGRVGIDMLAGPSELLVLSDPSADPDVIAADLIAQAEHDVDARPILVTLSSAHADAVAAAAARRLATLPTAAVARAAFARGFACVAESMDEAIAIVDGIAPEHLELQGNVAATLAPRIRNAGAIFIGAAAAEVIGDYGAGPNHTLPTGGSARWGAGLSVVDFLRLRTWIRIDDRRAAQALYADTEALARHEGLSGHAASAAARRTEAAVV